MSDKPTKVYLLLEVESTIWPEPDIDEIKERAVDLVGAKIAENRDQSTEDGSSWFDMGNGGMAVKEPVVLPDDIHAILKRNAMRGVPLHEQLRQAVIENGKRPAKEQFQALIDRGAINEKGEVLLRGPGCNDGEEVDE